MIEADTSRGNAVIIRGTPGQIADIEAALRAIDSSVGVANTGQSIITLPGGSATQLAEQLQRMLEAKGIKTNVVTPRSLGGRGRKYGAWPVGIRRDFGLGH